MAGAGDIAPSLLQLSNESGERSWHGHKVVADAQGEAAVDRCEVVRPKTVDPTHWEGVEHDETTGHAVAQIDALLKEETIEQVKALAFGDGAWRGLAVGWQAQR
jgi:hypothetical protein